MKKILAAAAAIAAAFTLAFCGCTDGKKETANKNNWFHIMDADAYIALTDGRDDPADENYNRLIDRTREALEEIDKSLSVTRADSVITAFNNAEAGARVELDKTAYDVLGIAMRVYELTDGYYNPAVYYSVMEYGFGGDRQFPTSESELPKDSDVQKYTALAESFKDLELYSENGAYYAVKPYFTVEVNGEKLPLKIDLGGIGKGYAADRAGEIMDVLGYGFGYFDFGASSIAFKSYKKGVPFTMSIASPRQISGKSSRLLRTQIDGEYVSTSGDYVEFYELGERRYCHIINPKTGRPVDTGVISATVVGSSAAEADALSTAIMAMGRERATEFMKEKLASWRVVFACEEDKSYGFVTNMEESGYTLPENCAFSRLT